MALPSQRQTLSPTYTSAKYSDGTNGDYTIKSPPTSMLPSILALPLPPPPPLPRNKRRNGADRLTAEQIGPQLKDVITARERLHRRRTNMKNRQRDIVAQLPWNSKAQAEFIERARQLMDLLRVKGGSQDPDPELKERLEKVESLHNLLHGWVGREPDRQESREEEELWKYESRVLEQEKALYSTLKSLQQPTASDTDDTEETEDVSTIAPSTPSVDSTEDLIDPVETQYYSVGGDMDLIRDEILDLESEVKRQELRRAERIAEGLPLEPSNITFLEEYPKKREAIRRQYYDCQALMERLAQDCRKRGIEVQPPEIPPFPNQTSFQNRRKSLPDRGKSHSRTRSQINTGITLWVHRTEKEAQDGTDLLIQSVGNLSDRMEPSDSFTDQEADALLSLPRYTSFMSPDESDRPTEVVPLPRSASFQGELPSRKRRYSSPDHLPCSSRIPGGRWDEYKNSVDPLLCKACFGGKAPRSVA